MDIKDLNKSQLILLCLLISFVTSIATGVTAVSLLQQAPQEFTNTVNRVVEKTIQTVVPGDLRKTNTVVIKQDDLVVDAVSRTTPAVGSIYLKSADIKKDTPIGVGFVLSEDGRFITDSGLVNDKDEYIALIDGTNYTLSLEKEDGAVALFKITAGSTETKIKDIPSVTLGDAASLKVGQTIIALTRNPVSIAQGVITELTTGIADGAAVPDLVEIKASQILGDRYRGAPVLDIDGNSIGMVVKGSLGFSIVPETLFIPKTQAKESSAKY